MPKTKINKRRKAKSTPASTLVDMPGLTKREAQVAVAVGQGKTYPEIAKELELQLETVRSYVNHLRNKTGLRRKVELALWANHKRAWLEGQLTAA